MTPGRRIELGALVALAIFLPLYEAPKSIAWLAYAVAWGVNRARRRDFGGPWDVWDTLLAAWIASGFVVAAFAGLHGDEWRGAIDLLRYGAVAWLLKRSDYSSSERRWVFFALVGSLLAGLALGHWRLWVGGAEFLQLNSVGHVNHTAVYIAIMLGACAAWMYAGGGPVAVLATLIALFSIVISESRAGIGVALFMLLVLAAAWWPRSRRPIATALILIAATIGLSVLGGAEVVRKQQRNIQQNNVLAYRDGIWRAALVAWERYPLFGIGMDNYNQVNQDKLRRWRSEAGRPYEAKNYSEFPHAHSLYLTTLAERGIAGILALGAVLLAWLVALVRRRPGRDATDDDWVYWGAAAAAWIITTGVGLVNTTLHHEHGLLAMLFLGLWLSRRPGRNSG